MMLNSTSPVVVLSLLVCWISFSCKVRNDAANDLSSTPDTLNIVDNSANVRIGTGYDTVREKVRGPCLTSAENVSMQALPGSEAGKKVYFDVEAIESREDLKKFMHITARASLNYGVGGGSAKVDISNKQYIRQDSLVIVFRARVENSYQTMGDVQVSDEMKKRYLENPGEFHIACGDTYISGLTTGGELYGFFEYSHLTKENRQTLLVAVKGHSANLSGSLSVNEKEQEKFKHDSLSVTYLQSGGVPTTPISPKEFFAKLSSYASTITTGSPAVDGKPAVSGNSWPLTVSLQDYYAAGLPVGDSKNIGVLESKRAIIGGLSRNYDYWLDRLLRVDDIIGSPETYQSYDENAMRQEREKVAKNLDDITIEAGACLADIYSCPQAKQLEKSSFVLPKEKDAIAPPPPVSTVPPLVKSMKLVMYTTDDAKNKDQAFSVSVVEGKNNIVKPSLVTKGIEYPRNSTRELALTLLDKTVNPKQEFTLIVTSEPFRYFKWHTKFQIVATVTEGGADRVYLSPVSRMYPMYASASFERSFPAMAIYKFKLSATKKVRVRS